MIHREGMPSIIIALILSMVIGIAFYVYLPQVYWIGIIIALFIMTAILQFFRNPRREIPIADDNLVYAPADGSIVVVEKAYESEYLKRDAIQVSIFMSPVNVHVNRMPFSGSVEFVKYHPGKYLVAWHPKSSTENERTTIAINNGNHLVLLRQIAGAVARRIKWYVNKGDTLTQGEDIGFIKFGSRVDLFLPEGALIKVKIGQTVYGNKDVIAELPR